MWVRAYKITKMFRTSCDIAAQSCRNRPFRQGHGFVPAKAVIHPGARMNKGAFTSGDLPSTPLRLERGTLLHLLEERRQDLTPLRDHITWNGASGTYGFEPTILGAKQRPGEQIHQLRAYVTPIVGALNLAALHGCDLVLFNDRGSRIPRTIAQSIVQKHGSKIGIPNTACINISNRHDKEPHPEVVEWVKYQYSGTSRIALIDDMIGSGTTFAHGQYLFSSALPAVPVLCIALYERRAPWRDDVGGPCKGTHSGLREFPQARGNYSSGLFTQHLYAYPFPNRDHIRRANDEPSWRAMTSLYEANATLAEAAVILGELAASAITPEKKPDIQDINSEATTVRPSGPIGTAAALTFDAPSHGQHRGL